MHKRFDEEPLFLTQKNRNNIIADFRQMIISFFHCAKMLILWHLLFFVFLVGIKWVLSSVVQIILPSWLRTSMGKST